MNESLIKRCEEKIAEAIKESDIEQLKTLLHDNLVFLSPDGSIITKEIDIASHKSGSIKAEEIIIEIERVNIDNDIATVIVTYQTKGLILGKPISGKYRYLRVWKKFGNELKIICGSCIEIQ